MVIQMTREQYKATYGEEPNVFPSETIPKTTATPIQMTREQYKATYGSDPVLNTQTTKTTKAAKVVDDAVYTPQETSVAQPTEKKTFWEKYNNFSNRLGQLGAEFNIGLIKSTGSTLGALQSVGNTLLNPLEKALDKAMGVTTQKKYSNIGDEMNDFADMLDKHTGVKEKNYIDNVFEGLGSTAPFLVGGIVGKSAGISQKLLNLGLSGTEALVNSYDDYNELTKDHEGTKIDKMKALASFGGNLVVNALTNKLGFLHEGEASSIIDATRRFVISGLSESSQEMSQQIISNLVTGKDMMEGVKETGLVSLPSAFLFGGGSFIGNVSSVKQKEELKKFVDDIAQSGVSKSKVLEVLRVTTGDQNIQDNEAVSDIVNSNDKLAENTINTASELLNQGLGEESAILELMTTENMSQEDARSAVNEAKQATSEVVADNTQESTSSATFEENTVSNDLQKVSELSEKSTIKQIQEAINNDQQKNESQQRISDRQMIENLQKQVDEAPRNTRMRKELKIKLSNAKEQFAQTYDTNTKAIRNLVTTFIKQNQKVNSLSKNEVKLLTNNVIESINNPSGDINIDNTKLSSLIKTMFKQFADKNGGRGAEKSKISQEVVDKTKKDGGVTVSTDGKYPDGGYAYAPRKDTEVIIPVDEFSEKHVNDFQKKNAELLKIDGNNIGTWISDGNVYLDISRVGKPSTETLQEAQDNEQLAVFDLSTFQEIQTGQIKDGVYNKLDEAINIYSKYQEQNSKSSDERGNESVQGKNEEKQKIDESKKLTPYDTIEVIETRESIKDKPQTYEINTKERQDLRKEISDKLYGDGAKNKNKRVDIVTGGPGSRKSSMISNKLSDKHGSLIIDADQAKKLIPEYGKNGIGAGLVHEESSHIVKDVRKKAITNGDNIVLSIVGDKQTNMEILIKTFNDNGYDIHLHNAHLPLEISIPSIVERFISGEQGFVDPQYALKVGLTPTEVHDTIKTYDGIKSQTKYSTDVERGQDAKILEYSSVQGNADGSQAVDKRGETNVPSSDGGYNPLLGVDSNLKTSGLARRLQVEATKMGLENLGKLTEFETINQKEQAEMAVDLVNSDYEKAIEIALGEENPPSGLKAVAVWTAVKNEAKARGDIETIQALGTRSSITREVSEAAQTLGLVENNELDPTQQIEKVSKKKRKKVEKKLEKQGKTLKEVRQKEKQKLKKEIEKTQPTKNDWSSFINSIKC